ncbi:MAG: hypothetical protein H0X24_17850, partial [Ktedonobacterales bacterium]|nr:hypothetical protein [Ktedonobacterales bacterium]
VIVGMAGLVYASVQQNYRASANDPQIQMAQDARVALQAGTPAGNLVAAHTVDLASSLAPYMIIYDAQGQVMASSASLNGTTPTIPPGVLTSAKHTDVNLVTWQPAVGVRSAVAVVAYPGGYVLAGRSITVIEKRESATETIAGAAALALLAASLVGVVASRWLLTRLDGTAA